MALSTNPTGFGNFHSDQSSKVETLLLAASKRVMGRAGLQRSSQGALTQWYSLVSLRCAADTSVSCSSAFESISSGRFLSLRSGAAFCYAAFEDEKRVSFLDLETSESSFCFSKSRVMFVLVDAATLGWSIQHQSIELLILFE
jgi:hypothetical protein